LYVALSLCCLGPAEDLQHYDWEGQHRLLIGVQIHAQSLCLCLETLESADVEQIAVEAVVDC